MLPTKTIALPNLDVYREKLLAAKNSSLEIRAVPHATKGLLESLPKSGPRINGWPWTIQSTGLLPTMPSGRPWPRISIVVPTYQQGKFVEETLRSIILQNYPNLEIMVIDGGSTDGTLHILESYSPWLSYWHSVPDNGQSQAINLGFSLAQGDIYAWINSDDIYMPGIFEKVALEFTRTDVEFLYGNAITLEQNRKSLRISNTTPLFSSSFAVFGGSLMQPACFWRAAVHEPVWEELSCALDNELWRRLVHKTKRGYLDCPVAIMRIHVEAKSSSEQWKQKWSDDIAKIRQHYTMDGFADNGLWKLYRLSQKLFSIWRCVAGRKAKKKAVGAVLSLGRKDLHLE